jgi:predicted ATP-binding protein involved in virulence
MCDKCTELDKQIAEYQRQIRSTLDLREVERLQAQVRELISQKIGFHSRPAS